MTGFAFNTWLTPRERRWVFCIGQVRHDLDSDRKLVLSLIKDIEIIGEAANKISTETRQNHPDIPWGDIVSMRHHLIHEYFDVDLEILWNTIVKDLPVLTALLENVLRKDEGIE